MKKFWNLTLILALCLTMMPFAAVEAAETFSVTVTDANHNPVSEHVGGLMFCVYDDHYSWLNDDSSNALLFFSMYVEEGSDTPVTPPAPTYTVTITSDANGMVTAAPSSATAGTEVVLKVAPDANYQLKAGSLQVVDAGDTAVALQKISDAEYLFIMPASNVGVTAAFEFVSENIVVVGKLEEVPAALASGTPTAKAPFLGVETPKALENLMEEKLVETFVQLETTEEEDPAQMVLMDVELVVSQPDGTTRPVTEQDFIDHGGVIETVIKLPDGSKATDQFFGIHVFSQNWNGKKAGEYEMIYPKVINGELHFNLTGCSPVMISWIPAEEVPSVPATGDDANLMLWAALVLLSASCAVVLYRRKNAKAKKFFFRTVARPSFFAWKGCENRGKNDGFSLQNRGGNDILNWYVRLNFTFFGDSGFQ